MQGNAEFHREDIHRPDRKNPQLHVILASGHNAVDHLVDRSITPGGHNRGVSLESRFTGDLLGITGKAAETDLAPLAERGKPIRQATRFFTAGGWIQDDQGILHTSQLRQAS